MKNNLGATFKRVSYALYTAGVLFLVLGIGLSLVTQPVQAFGPPSVAFDGSDFSSCQTQPQTMSFSGTVTLPEGVSATLQTQWYIQWPEDLRTAPDYQTTSPVTDGFRFTVNAQWPGIRPGDTVVEIHAGAILLDINTGNPISSGASIDVFWYPWVCAQPTATFTPVVPTSTFTPTNTPVVPTATFTETPTNTPVGPTATFTNTPEIPTATNTPEVPTATNTQPVPPGTTVTATNTPEGPTNTPEVPTNTPEGPTNTPEGPTNTPEVPTNTPEGPTNTPPPPPGTTVTPPTDPTATQPPDTGTQVPTLPPPPEPPRGNQPLIPVTGADLSGPVIGIDFYRSVSINLGLALLGLALMMHAVSLRLRG